MKKTFILIAIVVAAVLGAFYVGQNRGVRKTVDWYNNHTDTTSVVQIDSNKYDSPIPDTVYKDKPVYYPVYIDSEIPEPQIIYKDSIVYVRMDKVIKEYKTENYFAQISGVDPNLDYIETYNKTVTSTVYIPKRVEPKKDFFEIDARFMYNNGLAFPVTVNFGHRYGVSEFYVGAGRDFINDTWVGQVGWRMTFGIGK